MYDKIIMYVNVFCLGLLYAIGGFDGISPLRSAEVYDPHTDRWTPLPDMSSNRFGLGACHCDGELVSYPFWHTAKTQ